MRKKIILLLILILFIFIIKNKKKEYFFNNKIIFENIEDFCKNNKDNNIIFCVANYSIKEMVENLIISSNKNNIKLILFALDEDIIKYINNKCTIVKYFDSNIISGKFYKYGTNDFKKIVFHRFMIGNYILKSNKTYIYLDTDIVITNNFEADTLNHLNETGVDCVIQFNGTNCCTGFFSMKPTKNTLNFNIKMLERYDYKKYEHDQHFFNKVVLNKKLLNIRYLSREKYPNGKYYYNNQKIIENKCYIIHFNCVVGYNNKINKMKKYKKWYL